jgi:hypothetical protein
VTKADNLAHSFEICIDESGDQGFTFSGNSKSSEWFIVAGIVTVTGNVPKLQERVRAIKQMVGCHDTKHLHFRKLKSEVQRRSVITEISQMDKLCRSIVVMIHKPSLQSPEAFMEDNRLYFYASRILLERASWLCASTEEYRTPRHGDRTAKVIFSGLPELSREKIGRYFDHLKLMETKIDWTVIKADQFESLSPRRHAVLQIADCVAASFYCAEHPHGKVRTPEWAQNLKPLLYRSQRGKYRGYGLKVFPPSVETQTAQGHFCPWAVHFPS